jgi:hypothetical protein
MTLRLIAGGHHAGGDDYEVVAREPALRLARQMLDSLCGRGATCHPDAGEGPCGECRRTVHGRFSFGVFDGKTVTEYTDSEGAPGERGPFEPLCRHCVNRRRHVGRMLDEEQAA